MDIYGYILSKTGIYCNCHSHCFHCEAKVGPTYPQEKEELLIVDCSISISVKVVKEFFYFLGRHVGGIGVDGVFKLIVFKCMIVIIVCPLECSKKK